MTDRPQWIVARDLMIDDFSEIESRGSLRRAMNLLVDLHNEQASIKALIVVDGDGNYVGLLTARLLFRGLFTLWMPSQAVIDDERRLEEELLRVTRERLDVTVHDALVLGLPTVAPDERLLSLIAAGCEKRMDYLPVVENGKAIGLVPITSVLEEAAALALTPEDEGIRFDGKTFK